MKSPASKPRGLRDENAGEKKKNSQETLPQKTPLPLNTNIRKPWSFPQMGMGSHEMSSAGCQHCHPYFCSFLLFFPLLIPLPPTIPTSRV